MDYYSQIILSLALLFEAGDWWDTYSHSSFRSSSFAVSYSAFASPADSNSLHTLAEFPEENLSSSSKAA